MVSHVKIYHGEDILLPCHDTEFSLKSLKSPISISLMQRRKATLKLPADQEPLQIFPLVKALVLNRLHQESI